MAGNLVQHFMNKLGLDSAKTSIKEHPSQKPPSINIPIPQSPSPESSISSMEYGSPDAGRSRRSSEQITPPESPKSPIAADDFWLQAAHDDTSPMGAFGLHSSRSPFSPSSEFPPNDPRAGGVAKKSPGSDKHIPINDSTAHLSEKLMHQPARPRRDSWESMLHPQGSKLAHKGSAQFYDTVSESAPSQSTIWEQITSSSQSPMLDAIVSPEPPRRRSMEHEHSAAFITFNRLPRVSLDMPPVPPVHVPAGLKQAARPQVAASGDPWGAVFNPGLNPRMSSKKFGGSKFDNPASADTVWSEIIKSNNESAAP